MGTTDREKARAAVDKKRTALADAIRDKRVELDISQEVLGDRLGIRRLEMTRIESGQVKSIDTYIAVAEALGLELCIRKIVPAKTSKYE